MTAPIQGNEDIGPEILKDLVRLEGINLSQMQNQFTELTHHVKEWSLFASRFDDFIKGMDRQTAAFSNLVKLMMESVRGQAAVSTTRTISFEEAMQEILELFKGSKDLFYSDIAESLQLDFATVIKACAELEKQGKIKGLPNEEE